MAKNGMFPMTPEKRHEEVMKSVLEQVQDTDYILKGGTALLLTRDLDRHSTDLDFDASRKINLEKRIEKGIKTAGVELVGIKPVKDTNTVQRFKAHYINPENGKDTLLKVETSFRNAPDIDMLETVNNIRTYKVEYIFNQKLEAAEDRTKPRDLYDLAHLVKRHGDKLSDNQISKIDIFSRDMTKLEQRYENSFNADPVLSSKTAEDTILRLRDAIEVQAENRSLTLLDDHQNSEVNRPFTDSNKILNEQELMTEQIKQEIAKEYKQDYGVDSSLTGEEAQAEVARQIRREVVEKTKTIETPKVQTPQEKMAEQIKQEIVQETNRSKDNDLER